MILKRKQTTFKHETYCAAIDHCLDGIDGALEEYGKAKEFEQRDKACVKLVYWSNLNVKIVTRRNREQLGTS